jgi:hypothetical protein
MFAHRVTKGFINPLAAAAPAQTTHTNLTTHLEEPSVLSTPHAQRRKSKRKLLVPLKTALADSKRAAAPAARLPPEQPASKKPTTTAPAATQIIG